MSRIIQQNARIGYTLVAMLAAVLIFELFADQEQAPTGSNAVLGLPLGTIVAFGGPAEAVPEREGWLLCDGREVSAQEYNGLFAVIQYAWGRGSGQGTFRLPDFRGRFLRGVDLTLAAEWRDPDRENRVAAYPGGNSGNQVGSVQNDEMSYHTHSLVGAARAVGPGDAGVGQWVRFHGSRIAEENTPDMVNETAVLATGGTETRPKNAYVNWIIKAR